MVVRQADFTSHCQDAVSGLRAAIIELYDSVQADPSNPQDVARRFGVNKTLTWNIARLVQADDDLRAASHVPGLSSMERMLAATAKNGAPDETVERVRTAVRQFDEMVEVHVGDRSALDLMLDSMGGGKSDSLEMSRKLAFRGTSGIFGVQARTRLASWIVAPSPDHADRLDMVLVAGYFNFRRLRPVVQWPIL
ncbi:MAG: hypothetical protein AAFX05_08285, partial [Planctomycetota bacterium]